MNRPRNTVRRHAIALAALLALGGAAQAQLGSATLKGQVSSGSSAVQAGTVVTAVNTATGNTWRTSTLADGSYVLTGLAPGSYEIRVNGPGGVSKTETVTLQVGETAAVDLSLGGGQQITIVGAATRADVRTSEVGTNVSRRLIEKLPQQTRNFLSSADLAPGVAFSSDSGGNTRVQAGAQNFDHVNVFIDGVGMKNNILRGGVTGQDTSRGNPFPQSAIAEYKVLTQNYKAEYDQVSSAAITAVTKSGTNEFHVDAYLDRTGTNWRAMTPFEKEKQAAGIALPPSSKNEFGVSAGGAIVPDQMHYFFAYDGKRIQDSRQIQARNLDQLPAGQGIVPRLAAAQGARVDDFTEHLLFGRFDAQFGPDSRITVTARVRRESDKLAEDKQLSMPGNDKERRNEETRFDAAWDTSGATWQNVLRGGYEDAVWNPRSSSTTPFIKYKVSTALPPRWDASQDVLFEGGSPDAQRRQQKGFTLGNDFTYTGLASHVLKTGARVKAMKYDLSGTARSVDVVEVTIDRTTGLPYFDGTNCLGTNFSSNAAGQTTTECRLQRAVAPNSAVFSNKQVGLYFQDDWTLTKQLELNLGVRWDYETNMLNNDYVTPADRVAALKGPDTRTVGSVTAPPGATYDQALAKGGINIDDYIATGNSRKPYKRAIAPRLGLSFDVTGNRSTVVFGGWGRSYDRTMANHALDEKQKNQTPGSGEIWLIRNDIKLPYADQASIGLRQAVGEWNAEAVLTNERAKNQFIWFGGDRDPNGGWSGRSVIDPLFSGPQGYNTLILGDFVGETKTSALLLSLEKPYTKASGWSMNVAYTYSDAKTTHNEWNNDIFDWTYGKPNRPFNTSRLVDKHRLVVAGVADGVLPWGLSLSGKAVYGSGLPRRIVSCAAGFDKCIAVQGDAPSFRQVDLSLSKELSFGSNTFGLRVDLLNAFNTTNYGGFDDWGGGPVAPGNPANAVGGDNLNLGKPNDIRGDTRTLRLALSYKF